MIKKILPFFLIFCLMTVFSEKINAQASTYQQVYNILQAKCAGCHNQSINSGQLNLAATPSAVYSKLVNFNPVNPAALAKGNKRVAPGDPHRSFLLRKINNGLDSDNGISQPSEGDVMPSSPNPALSKYEIELVRQWIFHGAPQTGVVVDTALINEYYTVGGINSVPAPLAPPAAGTGFQVHLGKLFVPKATEMEFFIKYNPKLPDTLEVISLTLAQSAQSHHLVIYKFFPGQDVNFPQGLRDTSQASHGSADAMCAFAPQQSSHVLPPGTAYFLEQNAIFDLNLHIVNQSQDSVLGAEIYFNMYTQQLGIAQKYMYRRNYPDLSIVIPPGDTSSFTQVAYDSSETNMWEIWILYTHTHRYGVDYDVWQRNSDGSQGGKVYEGWMDWSYSFNQGYYGWGIHSPQEHFDNPFLEINPLEGLIHKATYFNYGTDTAYFGLTSQDEMMVMGFEYTYGPPIPQSGIHEPDKLSDVKIFPNPTADGIIRFQSEKNTVREVEVQNLVGEKVFEKTVNADHGTLNLSALSNGIYIYRMKEEKNNAISTGKIIISR